MYTEKMAKLVLISLLLYVTACTCDDAGWQNAAQMLEQAIDETADPCTDWFQFSCGNWVKHFKIQPGYSSASPLGNLGITASKQLKDAMAAVDLNTAPHAIKQAKIYNDLCKHKSPVDGNDIKRFFIKLYQEINTDGGWPALMSNWNGPVGGDEYKSAGALMGRMLGLWGVKSFIHASVDPDWRRPEKWAIILHDGGYVPSPEKNIINIMQRMAQANNLTIDNNKFKKHAEAIAALEEKLEKVTKNRPSLDNATEAFYYTKDFDLPYHAFSLGDLEKRFWFLEWREIFKFMAQGNVPEKQLLTTEFIVPYPEILDQLRDIYISTNPETMQDFLIWRVLNQFMYLLTPSEKANKKACASTENTLSNAVSRPFVEKWKELYSAKSIEELDSMVILILDALRDMFSTLTWMNADSLKGAYAKLNKMGRNIAYPPWVLDDKLLNEAYAKLDLSVDDDPLTFAFKVHRFQAWTHINKVNTLADFKLFNFQNHYLYTLNAWYQPWYNSITIPAAIFQYPMFGEGWPKAVSYGAMGGVVGHEITHGLDTTGVQWDSTGSKKVWMDDKSFDGFLKMAQCVIDQYSNVCYPNLATTGDQTQGKCIPGQECICVNGDHTKAEDIADSGGTLAAYLAYKKYVLANGEEKRLPGKLSKYTMDQVFFLSFAHNWCSIETAQSLKRAAEAVADLRGHSPEPIRGVESLKNILPFAEAFNCPVGSVMAPKDHCKVWIGRDFHINDPLIAGKRNVKKRSIHKK